MDRFWLASYPEGVPAEIDSGRYRSLPQMMDDSFARHAERDAFVCMGRHMTYRELDLLSTRFGAWLQSRGLEKGSRVAIMMPNVLQYPVALAAVLRAGCTVVNVNPLYTARELEHQLNDSGAEAILILENFAHTLAQVLPRTRLRHIVLTSMGELLGGAKGALVDVVVRRVKKLVPPYALPGAVRFRAAVAAGARMRLAPADPQPDDLAFLQYTGGTTGVSKGAALTHRNLVANVLQLDAWMQPALRRLPPGEQLSIVCALPLYHIFALTICDLLGMRAGASNLLIPNPRDMAGFVKTLGRHRFHMLPGVNTLYNGLLNRPDFASLDFSGLKLTIGGGMAVQQAVAEKWLQVTGCPILEGYGLSETSPCATANPVSEIRYSGSIGVPLPSTEVAILGDDGRALPLGQPGEIGIRGPQVMSGYWGRPDETAKVMTADGFFRSGDIGVMDERGYVRIVDRKKDMILVSGFNVYPNEIEGVVAAHPGVLECACIGVPDAASGEAVKLFVVRRDPSLTVEQLMAFCREQLTAYKKPKIVEFRTELPKTNVGKILRRALREPQAPQEQQEHQGRRDVA